MELSLPRPSEHARGGLGLAVRVARRDMRAGGELLACALAMRFFGLLLPFTAALLATTGLVTQTSPETARGALTSLGIASTAARSVTESARLTHESLWLVLGGSLFALLLASRTTLRGLWAVHRLAWDEPPHRPGRPWLGAVAVIGAVLFMMATSLIGPLMRHGLGFVAGIAGFGIELGLITGFWLVASTALPHGGAPWPALVAGAALLAAGVTLLHATTVLWAGGVMSHYSSAYGALGTAVAVLLWLYLVGRLVVAAAMLNAARWESGASHPGDARA